MPRSFATRIVTRTSAAKISGHTYSNIWPSSINDMRGLYNAKQEIARLGRETVGGIEGGRACQAQEEEESGAVRGGAAVVDRGGGQVGSFTDHAGPCRVALRGMEGKKLNLPSTKRQTEKVGCEPQDQVPNTAQSRNRQGTAHCRRPPNSQDTRRHVGHTLMCAKGSPKHVPYSHIRSPPKHVLYSHIRSRPKLHPNMSYIRTYLSTQACPIFAHTVSFSLSFLFLPFLFFIFLPSLLK